MRDIFQTISDHVRTQLKSGEEFSAYYAGESSDFVRFNHGKIRQPGSVTQGFLSLRLIQGKKHATSTFPLSGSPQIDRDMSAQVVSELRNKVTAAPEDPYLLLPSNVSNSERIEPNRLPRSSDAVAEILSAANGKDLVGIYASGTLDRGFANSAGQRNWFSSSSFQLDWSFYFKADKAVKTVYSGKTWDRAGFERKMEKASAELDILGKNPKTVPPGKYRVYLSPTALAEIVSMMNWDGFGLRAHKTRSTPFLKLAEKRERWNPAVTMTENTGAGIAPNFSIDGFIKPDAVCLIEKGEYRDTLVSPRSAREFNAETNGADDSEATVCAFMNGGELPEDRILSELDTGIFINNLWYINFSDRASFRLTGMTRFATFWVENGKIQAPLSVMRFDETVGRILGENLLHLTNEPELMLSTDTYESRKPQAMCLPGALVKDFRFTM